jgi:hypothetical protein
VEAARWELNNASATMGNRINGLLYQRTYIFISLVGRGEGEVGSVDSWK